MTTNAEKYNASSSLVQPTTENETQSSTGDTFHRVLINNEYFTLGRTEDKAKYLFDCLHQWRLSLIHI